LQWLARVTLAREAGKGRLGKQVTLAREAGKGRLDKQVTLAREAGKGRLGKKVTLAREAGKGGLGKQVTLAREAGEGRGEGRPIAAGVRVHCDCAEACGAGAGQSSLRNGAAGRSAWLISVAGGELPHA